MNCKRCWYYTEIGGCCEWPNRESYRKFTPISEIKICPRYGTKNPLFQTEKTVAVKWYKKGKLEEENGSR